MGEPLVVVRIRRRHDVEIEGLSSGTVELGSESTDEHVVDTVVVEYLENSSGVESLLLRWHVLVLGPR